MSTQSETVAETHSFQAEVAQLLHLMVHSVYSESDIFLRELISNASDALRQAALRSHRQARADGRRRAARHPHRDRRGGRHPDHRRHRHRHDRQELIDNLGTIARSGTRAFMSRLAEAKDGSGLIGQFGVGFYSAFMVADRIEVTSRRAGTSEAWVWRSTGGAGFEVAPATAEQAGRVRRGTAVVLHLKADAKRYLDPATIERVVKTYSDHILFPIKLADGQGDPRQINAASAIWQRPKSELKPEDYTQAYRTIAGDLRRAGNHPALQGRGPPGVRGPAVCAFATGRSTCSIPIARGAPSSTCAASTSATMPICCPHTCASCAA